MATSTPYLNLVKPAYSETADIGVLNENADKIDQAVSGQAQAIVGKPDDATEMPLGPNDTTLVSQAITNLQNEIGIVCTGNTCAISASTGQYVVLKNSTISGRADGLYTAAKTIPANTVIDSTYLTAVSGGGLNDLKGQVDSLNSKFAYEPVSLTGFDTTKLTEAYALKIGQLVLVRVTMKDGLAADWHNDINIGLPNRLIPPTAIFGTYRVNAGADIAKNAICVLNTNGKIQFLSSQVFTSTVPFEFIYPIVSF